MIWFDPKIGSKENKSYKPKFEQLFQTISYVSRIKVLEKEINEGSNSPILLISSGRRYLDIANIVENSDKVIMIVIFCLDLTIHLPLKERHIKIAIVANTFENLEKELKAGYVNHIRFSSKFLDSGEEKTFYLLEEQETILKGQEMKGLFFKDEGNITYPLYYKKIKFKDAEWEENLNRIELAGKNEEICGKYFINSLPEVLNKLRLNRDPKHIIRSYTDNGLYYMMNRMFRAGNIHGLDLFRIYAFALRGSMFLKGDPVQSDKLVYRKLELRAEHLKIWKENIGKIVLLNGYTSTSMDKQIIQTTYEGNCIMEFMFTRNVEVFEESLDKFNNLLWNGVYYPVDIHKYSKIKKEKEILFPPFYPIRILGVSTTDNIKYNIQIEAPIYINTGDVSKSAWKQDMNQTLSRTYCQKLCKVISFNFIRKVDLSYYIYIYIYYLGNILNHCTVKQRKIGFKSIGACRKIEYLNLSKELNEYNIIQIENTQVKADELKLILSNTKIKAINFLNLGN